MDKIIKKDVLEKIITYAFIMAAIDGDLDPKEVEIIENFTDDHWNDEWGDSEDFLNKLDKEVVEFFLPKPGRTGIEAFQKDFMNKYQDKLDNEHQIILIELMEKVMMADGVMDEDEITLLNLIKSTDN